LPGFLIPAAVAVFVLSACALLFLFDFILKRPANGDEITPPVIESHPPVTGTIETPKPTETPVLIETPQPAPTETPDGPDATPALFTGKATDYAAMPKTYGEARNLIGYTILDARDVTYENFLKLEIDMTLSDVMDIFIDAETDSTYYSFSESTRWRFTSNPTQISVEISDDDDKVIKAEFHDPYRVCADPADISMSVFLQLKNRITLDEVIDILGGDFFVSAISAKSESATTLTWYSDEGEITVTINSQNRVTAFTQAGFQLYPDARMNYDVLTNRQILDNFQKVSIGITFPELEVLMENYIPLYKTEGLFTTIVRISETYEYNRGYYSDKMYLRFIFYDGMLYSAYSTLIPDSLLTTTDYSSALQIGEGMSYSEVVEILGEGYMISVTRGYEGALEEYKWLLPGKSYYNILVKFEDGFVSRKPSIHYED